MIHAPPEADWKMFRALRAAALERYFERSLGEVVRLANESGPSPRERYVSVRRAIDAREAELARCFDDPRRSVMLLLLAQMRLLAVVEEEELLRFSAGTQESLARFLHPG